MVNKIILRIRLGCFSLKTVNGNDHNIYLIPLTDLIQSTAQALLLLCIQKARLVIQTAYGACPYWKSTCQIFFFSWHPPPYKAQIRYRII